MKYSRRIFLASTTATALAAPLFLLAGNSEAADPSPMDVFTALKTRRSVRAYAKDDISEKDMKTILQMAMLAPSAANEQPWDFVVIRNRDILAKAAEINHYAAYAKHAPAAILLCLNGQKEKIKGMAILDMGMCAENLMLAAHGLGIGSVFTGIYPMEDRMKAFRELCGLPKDVTPIGMIVLGYPKIKGEREADDRYNEKAIHKDKW